MLNQVRNFFSPPVFPEDEEKTRKASYANAIAFVFFGVATAYQAYIRLLGNYHSLSIIDMLVIMVAVFCAAGLVLLRRGHVRFTSFLLLVVTWVTANSISATGFGARDSSYILNFAIILMAGLLLGWQASLFTTIISIFSGFGLAYAEANDLIIVNPYPVTSFAVDMAFIFVINAVLIGLLINGLENALKKSKINLEGLGIANVTLNQTETDLRNRSAELITANEQLEIRMKKLRAVAEVTRTAAALRDFNELLSATTRVISDELGYYHVAIFLLDKQRQYAILRSANTEAGRKMLAREYRVPVGQLGIVSAVAQSGQARIAYNLGKDQLFFTIPELRAIQSELALPLKSGEEVIGILDLQSIEAGDFNEDDISILSILADQVGIALQNALLFEESQRALRDANIESLQASGQAWNHYAEIIETKGYRYDGIKSEALRDAKRISRQNDALQIPVQLRGQMIGRLKLSASDPTREWTEDELVMVRATAERVALALEGVRLLGEAQKRATREAFLSDVAAKLGTSFQLDSILRDTVQELGETLKNSTVTFQLVNPTTAPEPPKSNGAKAE